MTLIMLCRITFLLFCYELRCFVARTFSVNSYVKFDVTFMSNVVTKDILCHYFPFHKIYVKSENEQCGVFLPAARWRAT